MRPSNSLRIEEVPGGGTFAAVELRLPGGMVDTLALEASAVRRPSSNLGAATRFFVEGGRIKIPVSR